MTYLLALDQGTSSIVMPVGHKQFLKVVQDELAKAQRDNLMSADLVISVQEQVSRVNGLQDDIDHFGQRLRTILREDRQMEAINQIPGVGELTASASWRRWETSVLSSLVASLRRGWGCDCKVTENKLDAEFAAAKTL